MIKHTLILSTLLFAFDTNAGCVIDAPEIGDLGPSSELVCRELERRVPGSILAVEGRNIHSPEKVSVLVLVNGEPVTLRYELVGAAWRTAEGDAGYTEKNMAPDGLSMR